MSLSHLYKDFNTAAKNGGDMLDPRSELEIEEEKLRSFEDGYKSGWDDAVAAQQDSNTNLGAEFGLSLQEASFSFHEARAALGKELRQVLEPLLETMLPEMAQAALPSHILELVRKMTSEVMDRPIEISVAPARAQSLQALCEDKLKEPFSVIPDETVSEAQVFIKVGSCEQEIDFESWLQDVRSVLGSFFDNLEKEATNE